MHPNLKKTMAAVFAANAWQLSAADLKIAYEHRPSLSIQSFQVNQTDEATIVSESMSNPGIRTYRIEMQHNLPAGYLVSMKATDTTAVPTIRGFQNGKRIVASDGSISFAGAKAGGKGQVVVSVPQSNQDDGDFVTLMVAPK